MEPIDKDPLLEKTSLLEARLEEVEKSLEDPSTLNNPERLASLTREYKHLSEIAEKTEEYREIVKRIEEDREIVRSSNDQELKELAREELQEYEKKREEVQIALKRLLIPKDPSDSKNVIMEIRSGTGGEEAALFAADLYRMYSKYIERKGWRSEIMSTSPTELGGFKEIIFSVTGEDVYGKLKYENGVHRVQRIPETETGGRVHTSAASVVVLPEADEVDIEIEQKDIRIDVYRSSGPGGQSVNTTDSAVRITHIPTGIVVTCQDEKSQHKNKAKAMRVLRARLFDKKKKEEEAKIAANRRSIIGSGDRSAKIRTYNFPQGRVTDHRINLTLYKLQQIMAGDLDEIIEKMQIAEQEEKMNVSRL